MVIRTETGLLGSNSHLITKPREQHDQERKQKTPRQKRKEDASTGASASGARALAARVAAFYFRAPAKSFFRTRVDYMAFARATNPAVLSNEPWSWRTTSPGVLSHALRRFGWGFLPNHVLPPLLANVFVSSVLYTTYLEALQSFSPHSSALAKRPYPPPGPKQTFAAGYLAGVAQAIVACPMDALHVRFRTDDILKGRYKSMWSYAWHKSRDIGLRGSFAGFGLSVLKDSFGCGVFFAVFELVKAQGFYSFVFALYGSRCNSWPRDVKVVEPSNMVIKPHFAIEPMFLLFAGISASVAQQVIQYPLALIQDIHFGRMAAIDARASRNPPPSSSEMLHIYRHAYRKTISICKKQAQRSGGWFQWSYRRFWMNTLRQLPSTSVGLVMFELIRRVYAGKDGGVKIEKDRLEIILL